jgi:hypothetical protein
MLKQTARHKKTAPKAILAPLASAFIIKARKNKKAVKKNAITAINQRRSIFAFIIIPPKYLYIT